MDQFELGPEEMVQHRLRVVAGGDVGQNRWPASGGDVPAQPPGAPAVRLGLERNGRSGGGGGGGTIAGLCRVRTDFADHGIVSQQLHHLNPKSRRRHGSRCHLTQR